MTFIDKLEVLRKIVNTTHYDANTLIDELEKEYKEITEKKVRRKTK